MDNPVSTTPLPPYADVTAEIVRCGVAVDAAELHGSLSGYVCGGGAAGREDWMDRLTLDARAATDSTLDALFQASTAQLDTTDLTFELLLPDDDEPVAVRADALVAWCRGFLSGFGLADVPASALSPEGVEALDDMARIAASSFDCDDPDADEAAFAELVEFVRVAALLLHGDCVLGRRQRRQLH